MAGAATPKTIIEGVYAIADEILGITDIGKPPHLKHKKIAAEPAWKRNLPAHLKAIGFLILSNIEQKRDGVWWKLN